MAKILNVLDELGNHKDLGDGRYESGFWYAPDLNCQIIRLFAKDSDVSFLGGKIVGERHGEGKDGDRKVFIFEADPAERGRARPAQFRANGCVATYE